MHRPSLEPAQLKELIQLRLHKAGVRAYRLGAFSKARRYITGRNWTLDIVTEGPDHDLILSIVRKVGNQYDCQFDIADKRP